jgi:hypothetical protein
LRISTAFALACLVTGCGGGDADDKFATTTSESGITGATTDSGGSGNASDSSMTSLTGMTGSATSGMTTSESGSTGCASIDVDVNPVIATMVLLVDQSGTMWEDFGGQSRWDAIYDTLMDPVSGPVKSLENDVRFGLSLYSSMNGDFGPMCPMLTEVAPKLLNHGDIDATFSTSMPVNDGDTPTGDSIDAVRADLELFMEEGPKAIILATDGDPDTCEVPDPQMGQQESITAAQAAFGAGIKTFVISVGNDVAEVHLQELANAGVGLDPVGAELAPYYKALNAIDLADAFEEIIGGFVSCTLEIEGIVEPENVCMGTVRLDGMELDCGTDWDVQDGSTLELKGDACATFQDGGTHSLDASWPCGSIFIP